jgi:hypothetical protein
MTAKFIAESIARTEVSAETRRLEIAFADAKGRTQTVGVTPAMARALSFALGEFAKDCPSEGPAPTKVPREFAVGTGRYEQVVLVRFEDDVPYALDAEQAERLGRALVDQAEMIADEPVSLRQ